MSTSTVPAWLHVVMLQAASCRGLMHELKYAYLEDLFHLLGLQDEVYSAP